MPFFFSLKKKKKKYVVSNNKDFHVIQPKEFLEAVCQFGGPESSDEGGAWPLQTQHCQGFYFCVLPIKIGSNSEICTAKCRSSKMQPAFGTATCWRYLTKDKGRLYVWGLLCTACKHCSLTWLPVRYLLSTALRFRWLYSLLNASRFGGTEALACSVLFPHGGWWEFIYSLILWFCSRTDWQCTLLTSCCSVLCNNNTRHHTHDPQYCVASSE